MEGGLPAWKALGLPMEVDPVPDEKVTAPAQAARAAAPAATSTYKATLDKSKVHMTVCGEGPSTLIPQSNTTHLSRLPRLDIVLTITVSLLYCEGSIQGGHTGKH